MVDSSSLGFAPNTPPATANVILYRENVPYTTLPESDVFTLYNAAGSPTGLIPLVPADSASSAPDTSSGILIDVSSTTVSTLLQPLSDVTVSSTLPVTSTASISQTMEGLASTRIFTSVLVASSTTNNLGVISTEEPKTVPITSTQSAALFLTASANTDPKITSTRPSAIALPQPSSPSSPGLSSSVKIGIGLGVPLAVLVGAIISYLSFRYYRHRRSNRGSDGAPELAHDYGQDDTASPGGKEERINHIATEGLGPMDDVSGIIRAHGD